MNAQHTRAENAAAPRPPRSRALLWGGLGLVVLVLIQAFAVAQSPDSPWTQAIDDAWRSAFGVGPDSSAYTWFIPMFFQDLGQKTGLLAVAVLLPLLLVLFGRWRSAVFVFGVELAAPGLASQLLKNTVNRPRPAEDAALDLFGPLFQVDHGSFPSGHATSAGALAVILIALIPTAAKGARTAFAFFGAFLVLGMIWQRTLVNAHWFTDAVSGALLGIGVALLLWWAFETWLRKDYGRRPWFLPRRSTSDPTPLAR